MVFESGGHTLTPARLIIGSTGWPDQIKGWPIAKNSDQVQVDPSGRDPFATPILMILFLPAITWEFCYKAQWAPCDFLWGIILE